jgi:hypothetical protein
VLPNFVIVGVSRAGTTTAFNTLAQHPQILASSTKETRYFQAARYGEPLRPVAEYAAYFRRHADEPVVMECTPDYFYGGLATAAAIDETCHPRVAVILREPVSRLISFFQFMQGRLQVPATMTLAQYVERCAAIPPDGMDLRVNNVYTGVWGGEYARFLPAWLETYPDRCDVFFFDDLLVAPLALLSEQCRRLGVDPELLPQQVPVDNSAPAYRSPLAQRAAALGARVARPLLHRYPGLYAAARRGYEAVNKAPEAPNLDVPSSLRRELEAHYQPWNDELRSQLVAAGIAGLPGWLR